MRPDPVLLSLNIRSIPTSAVAALTAEMPPPRREKIESRKRADDRLRSLAAGLLSRAALGEWGLSDGLLCFDTSGRPYVAGQPDCFLSLSHSGDWALCLLCAEPCAVDVQEHVGVIEAILKTGYTQEEQTAVGAAADREAAFWALWCRKECKAKLRPYARLREIDSLRAEPGYAFFHFSLPGYACAAYCTEQSGRLLTLRDGAECLHFY